MLINRRELLKTTALGTASLALTTSFNHLTAMSVHAASGADGVPHRFVFIRKSNGNLTKQFGLPSFSSEELKKHQGKQAFEVDLAGHELPDWLKMLDEHKFRLSVERKKNKLARSSK